mmetsp:Transcript_126337/g.252447  ORF Transcript_126337/g.252447 Transcript_126337/m.252447 type:complete len:154 (-) Transcript_126337:55-516(-)
MHTWMISCHLLGCVKMQLKLSRSKNPAVMLSASKTALKSNERKTCNGTLVHTSSSVAHSLVRQATVRLIRCVLSDLMSEPHCHFQAFIITNITDIRQWASSITTFGVNNRDFVHLVFLAVLSGYGGEGKEGSVCAFRVYFTDGTSLPNTRLCM